MTITRLQPCNQQSRLVAWPFSDRHAVVIAQQVKHSPPLGFGLDVLQITVGEEQLEMHVSLPSVVIDFHFNQTCRSVCLEINRDARLQSQNQRHVRRNRLQPAEVDAS